MEDKSITEKELESKIEDLKERFKRHIIKKTYLTNSTYPEYRIQEHKVKKQKTRKRAKIQKQSRKRNR